MQDAKEKDQPERKVLELSDSWEKLGLVAGRVTESTCDAYADLRRLVEEMRT